MPIVKPIQKRKYREIEHLTPESDRDDDCDRDHHQDHYLTPSSASPACKRQKRAKRERRERGLGDNDSDSGDSVVRRNLRHDSGIRNNFRSDSVIRNTVRRDSDSRNKLTRGSDNARESKYKSSGPVQPLTTAALATECARYSSAVRTAQWLGVEEAHIDSPVRTTMSTESSRRKRRHNPDSSARAASQSSYTTTAASERTSQYDKNCDALLLEHNIRGPVHDCQPSNIDAIRKVLGRRRNSLSPSRCLDAEFKEFKRRSRDAANEHQLGTEAIHPFLTSHWRGRYRSSFDQAFTQLDPIVAPPARMPYAKPDHSFGADRGDLDVSVIHSLRRYIVPTPNITGPVVPNNLMQIKGPDGSARVLETQITHDGAIGERAMHELRSFGLPNKAPADGIARTFLQSYHAGTLKFFAAYRVPFTTPRGSFSVQVVTTEIDGQYIGGSADKFRDGLRMYRNIVELAAKERDEAIQLANARVGIVLDQWRRGEGPMQAQAGAEGDDAEPDIQDSAEGIDV